MSRAVMQQALDALESDPVPLNAINNACFFLRAALAEPEQEPVANKQMLRWVEHLKRLSDDGQHMSIPGLSSGACWELAIELEQFIKNTAPTPRKPEQPYDQTALDLCKVCGWRTLIPSDACLNCERSKQPEQEPIGHADLGINNIYIFSALEPRVIPVGRTPLYTAPAPRKPLTEEEILAALVAVDPETKRLPPGFRAFARAIERAHGIGEQT